MKFGYARVSTTDQNLNTQIDAINKYGVDKIFFDKKKKKNMERKEFIKLLEQLRKGDTLVVSSLSRLGRKTKELIELIEDFNFRGVILISLKENIDTNSPVGRAMIGMISIFSELEREMIVERVKDGIKNARARGRIGGRPKLSDRKIKEAIILYKTNEYSVKEISNRTGVSKATLYRRLTEIENEEK